MIKDYKGLRVKDFSSHMKRFWSKVITKGNDECWEWQAGKTADGYGQFSVGKIVMVAHRVSYFVHNGNLGEKGDVLRHKCDNRACVNPKHLHTGTYEDNVADAINRNRFFGRNQGEAHGHSKLKRKEVVEIRNRAARGEYYKDIAKDYDTTVGNVSTIVSGKSWGHVRGPIEGRDYKRVRTGFPRYKIKIVKANP